MDKHVNTDTLSAAHGAQQELEHRYRQLAEFLPEAVYTCDLDGRVTQFNQAAVRLWGRTPVAGAEFWCGSHAMFTMAGDALAHDQCPMAVAVREARDVGRIEAVVERPNGERRYVLAHPQLTRSQDGRITGAVNVVVDITERKLLEEQLREIDRNKDAFFAMLAHELRNPLAPIAGAAELIQLKNTDPVVAKMAAVVARQTNVLRRLVDDLSDVARLARGGIVLRKALVTLDQVLESAADLVRPAALARRQHFSIAQDCPGATLLCDAVRLSQLIGNVLLNASKYTADGGAIELKAQVTGELLQIAVSDNGIGLAPGQLDSIFELYSQVDPGDVRGKGGMGVGLALVRDLCKQHGGTITAHSAGLGKGSRFEIRLPIVARGVSVH